MKLLFMFTTYSYNTARTLLEEIFGPKVNEDFPKKLLESRSCGDGFWETDGKSHYSHKGIMLEVTVGQDVNILLVDSTVSKLHCGVTYTALSTVVEFNKI